MDEDRSSHRSCIGSRGRGVPHRSHCPTHMGHVDHRSWKHLSGGTGTRGLCGNSEYDMMYGGGEDVLTAVDSNWPITNASNL